MIRDYLLKTAFKSFQNKNLGNKLSEEFTGEEGCDDDRLTLELFLKLFKPIPLFNITTFKYCSTDISKEEFAFLGTTSCVCYFSLLSRTFIKMF